MRILHFHSRLEVSKHLTGKETEPWEILYFKAYKSQLPVIEQALETAALMLGSDRSRGYCLEMICADWRLRRMTYATRLNSNSGRKGNLKRGQLRFDLAGSGLGRL
jgi:hypothetical protein